MVSIPEGATWGIIVLDSCAHCAQCGAVRCEAPLTVLSLALPDSSQRDRFSLRRSDARVSPNGCMPCSLLMETAGRALCSSISNYDGIDGRQSYSFSQPLTRREREEVYDEQGNCFKSLSADQVDRHAEDESEEYADSSPHCAARVRTV